MTKFRSPWSHRPIDPIRTLDLYRFKGKTTFTTHEKPHLFSLFGTVVFLQYSVEQTTTVDPGKELASSTAV
jgi:hypothetical protein